MTGTRPRVRGLLLSATAILPPVLVLVALPVAPASASTILGTTGISATIQCQADEWTAVQVIPPPSTTYAAGSAGVITHWSFAAGPDAIQAKFKMLRFVDTSTYQVIGASAVVTIQSGVVNTFSTRIPVQAGDVLGFTPKSAGTCITTAGGAILRFGAGDLGVGQSEAFVDGPAALPIAAVLEPDADGDGYGDESQDACPGQASAGAACDLVAPDTAITGGPRVSTTGKAKYKFTATEATATFECRLKGGKRKVAPFRSCTSPATYKHLKPGRYKFFVRAKDSFGNADATPAKRKLRVRSH